MIPEYDGIIVAVSMESTDEEQASILLAVQRTLRGDAHAFSVIVQDYSGPLYSLARNCGRSLEDAEEDVQEIFLKVYRALSRFDLSRQFKPWVFQIAMNHLKSARRRRLRRLSRVEMVNTDHQVLEEVASDNSQPPDHLALERMADEDVMRALDSLPRTWRDAFVLRQMQGLSGKEAAQILEAPEETVRTHLFRARQELQKLMRSRGWS